jgi:hypothetical protein
MPIEYVVVDYLSDRDVHIDGQITGKTNETLRVDRGHHIFDLGEPKDYQPESVEKLIRRTTWTKPLHIKAFHPL